MADTSSLNEQITALSKQAGQLRSTLQQEAASLPAEISSSLSSLESSLFQISNQVGTLENERHKLLALAKTTQAVNSTLELDDVLRLVMDTIISLTEAERGFLMLRDAQGEMSMRVARNWEQESLNPNEFAISRTIIQRVIETGTSVLTTNAQEDPRFDKQMSIVTFSLRSILCVPMKIKDELIGVIYTDNRIKTGIFNEAERDLLSVFANQAAIAIENARLFEEEQRRVKEANALAEISRDISTTLHLDFVLERIAFHAKDLLHAETSAVYLPDLASQTLRAIAASGPDGEQIKQDALVMGEGILGRIAQQQAGEIVNDATFDPRAITIEGTATVQYEHLIGVPVLANHQLIGLIAVWRVGKGLDFSARELNFMVRLADQVAIAINNARFFEETQKRLREMESVAEIGAVLGTTLDLEPLLENILRAVIKAIPTAERGSFLLADESGNLQIRATWGYIDPRVRGVYFPANTGYSSLCLRERRAVIISDVLADPEISYQGEISEMKMGGSALAVPLLVKDKPVGVIAIDTPSRVDAFSEEEMQLLKAISASAALAIENARLFQNTRQRLAEIEGLHALSVGLRTAQNLDEALPIILDQLLILFEAGGATLEMLDSGSGEIVTLLANGDWSGITGHRTPAGKGVSGIVIASGKPFVAADVVASGKAVNPGLFQGLLAVACVPITALEHTLGALWVGRKHQFSEEETRLLASIGEMVGNAIHRMMLNEQTERRANEFEALYRSAGNLSAQWDLSTLLSSTVTQAMELLHTSGGGLYLYDPVEENLQVVVARGSAMTLDTRLKLGEGMAGRVFLDHQPLIVDDYRKWEHRSPKYENASIGAVIEVPVNFAGESIGVLVVYESEKSGRTFTEAEAHLISLFASQAASAIHTARLLLDLQNANVDLTQAYDTTLEGWAKALEMRDKETEGHSRRVTSLTLKLARSMNVSKSEQTHILRGVLLHDIGKMGIPDGLLKKPGPLTDDEWVEMRKHPLYAYDLLHSISYLVPALDIPYCHHEKWDGTGYPRNLKGNEIPLAARIFSIVDVYDALLSDRPYRKAWPHHEVVNYLQKQSGKAFDPDIVNAFFPLLEDKNLFINDI